jgi:hypothetical protein
MSDRNATESRELLQYQVDAIRARHIATVAPLVQEYTRFLSMIPFNIEMLADG